MRNQYLTLCLDFSFMHFKLSNFGAIKKAGGSNSGFSVLLEAMRHVRKDLIYTTDAIYLQPKPVKQA